MTKKHKIHTPGTPLKGHKKPKHPQAKTHRGGGKDWFGSRTDIVH